MKVETSDQTLLVPVCECFLFEVFSQCDAFHIQIRHRLDTD